MAKPLFLQQAGETAGARLAPADPEVARVKKLVKLLEKASKSYRTYGSTNPLARRFVRQFHEELTSFLAVHHSLGFLVLRSTLYFDGQPVYQTPDDGTENLAFKLYHDGIRELVFHEGLSEAELAFFLEALAGNPDAVLSDDDIVTRLWEQALTTITCVTAEEVLRSSEFEQVLATQDSGSLNRPVSSLREVHATEQARQEQRAGTGRSGVQGTTGLLGYEVSEQEMEALAREVEAESTRDSLLYVLDILTAILSSEKSERLLDKLFTIFPDILDALTREGNWKGLNAAAGVLQEVDAVRALMSHECGKQLAKIREALGSPVRIKQIEVHLNNHPEVSTAGLLEFFYQIGPSVVPSLCMILGHLESPSHRALVCKALSILAKENPDPLVRALTDPRESYVLDLLAVVWNLNDPRFTEPLGKLVRHANVVIRKKALRLLDMRQEPGNGTWLIRFVADPDESIRHLALTTLSSGKYTAGFSDWVPIVRDGGFHKRSSAEKRGIFEAMRHTSGDESAAYWEQLVTKRFWFNRKKREELGTLAAAVLAKLGTAVAISALRAGVRHRNRAIREASEVGLEALRRQDSSTRAKSHAFK